MTNLSPLELMLQGFRLTTAQILYHMPDHPSLLQTYLWQDYDKNPDFPKLYTFLNFWEKELDGRLHSVVVQSCDLIKPSNFKPVRNEIYLG